MKLTLEYDGEIMSLQADDSVMVDTEIFIDRFFKMMLASGWHKYSIMQAANNVLKEWAKQYEEEKQ